MRRGKRRTRSLVIAIVVSITLLAGVGVYLASSIRSLEQGVGGEPPNFEVGDVPEISNIIPPPYLDLQFLANPFPIIIQLSKRVDPSTMRVYIEDDRGETIPVESRVEVYSPERMIAVLKAEIPWGYFEPGPHKLYVALGSVAEAIEVNIVLAKLPDTVELEVDVTRRGGDLTVIVESREFKPRYAKIVTCKGLPKFDFDEAGGVFTIKVDPEAYEHCEGKTHTLLIVGEYNGVTLGTTYPLKLG